MSALRERVALIVLLRRGTRPWREYADLIEETGSAVRTLERERGGQKALFEAPDSDLELAEQDLARWESAGMRVVTVLDPGYPESLRGVHDRPPLIFVRGELRPEDERAVAIVGARNASPGAIAVADGLSRHVARAGYTVVSGLALGIDTAAHSGALAAGGRTIAVAGTGLQRVYPPENVALQRKIAARCAVVSQFWPDSPPSRHSFPMRNAVISGLSIATVVVDASQTGGSRLQARLALDQGRPVFLWRRLLEHPWARSFANRPGVRVVTSPEEITSALAGLSSSGALVP